MLVLRKFMGKKAPRVEEEYEDESDLSDSSASIASRPRSGLARKSSNEDISPFTPALRSSHGKEAQLPEDLRSDWISLHNALKEVRLGEGNGVTCVELLEERMEFIRKLIDVVGKGTLKELPGGVVQVTLITLRDQMNRVLGLFGLVPRTNEQMTERTKGLICLLELVRFLVLHDTGPMLLNCELLDLYCRFLLPPYRPTFRKNRIFIDRTVLRNHKNSIRVRGNDPLPRAARPTAEILSRADRCHNGEKPSDCAHWA